MSPSYAGDDNDLIIVAGIKESFADKIACALEVDIEYVRCCATGDGHDQTGRTGRAGKLQAGGLLALDSRILLLECLENGLSCPATHRYVIGLWKAFSLELDGGPGGGDCQTGGGKEPGGDGNEHM